jgi:hypothetical protein
MQRSIFAGHIEVVKLGKAMVNTASQASQSYNVQLLNRVLDNLTGLGTYEFKTFHKISRLLIGIPDNLAAIALIVFFHS